MARARALINAIEPDERLVTVEDTLELQLSRHRGRHRNLLELECREENIEGQGEVDMRYLTRLALRLHRIASSSAKHADRRSSTCSRR